MIPEGENQKDYAVKAIRMLMDDLNIMGSKVEVLEGIIEGLNTSHRTLQQNFWRVMIDVIAIYAQQRHPDLRNEASVKLCQFITEKIKEYNDEASKNNLSDISYLPFV